MNHPWLGGSGSRRLAIVIVLVMAPPAAALVWLGVELFRENRSLLVQHDLEQRKDAADAAVRSLETSLASAEQVLSGASVPDGMTRIRISTRGAEVEPSSHSPWTSTPSPLHPIQTAPFDETEPLEYQGKEDVALAKYTELAGSTVPDRHAGALFRIARVHRNKTRWDEALSAYRDLAGMSGFEIAGSPVDLWAWRQRCAVLEEAGRTGDLVQQATSLAAHVLSGRWSPYLDRDTWDDTAADLTRWLTRERSGDFTRRIAIGNATVLLRASTDGLVGLVVPPPVLTAWLKQATKGARGDGVRDVERLTLLDEQGDVLAGVPPGPGPTRLERTPGKTGLPWTLVVSRDDPSSSGEERAARRSLFAIGAVMLLMAGGSYVLWSLVRRDLEVARQQTEFVSAVSHEFRTPLSSLRHITELLQENDSMLADRRRSFYDALGRNGKRLHVLVESVLDFARMEGGRKPYVLESIDALEFVSKVVSDFRGTVAPDAAVIEMTADREGTGPILADEGALTTALWNLFDNAVKYSSRPARILVTLTRHRGEIVIGVNDHGLGIPAAEQKAVFRKFVRGRKATELRIKGTGLGLAMVSHIVLAHGGRVELESQDGTGSTFRIVLPAGRAEASEDAPAPAAVTRART